MKWRKYCSLTAIEDIRAMTNNLDRVQLGLIENQHYLV